MKILVTGGTGVIGRAAIAELLRRERSVRLLSRHATQDARQWNGVEPFDGDVADAASLHGAAAGCDAVLHIAGIAAEHPPEATFDAVNVGGTRNILAESERSGVRRFVFVSSLGADRGSSGYHHSKLAAEKLVAASSLSWLIVRPGGVYGPGDEVTSQILKLVRTLPAMPVIGDGEQPFQPIWYEDLAKALANALERTELSKQVLELAGDETTSMNDLIRRFATLTDRHVAKVPVPMTLASVAVKLASLAGVELPADETKLAMLADGNLLDGPNGLTTLGVEPTPLERGLRALADALPETTPEDGVGSLHHKRFWADITGTAHTAESLMAVVRERAPELMAIEFAVEPGTPQHLERGATLTARIPMRGNIQVRVELVEPTRVVLSTIEGHPLAGTVQFAAQAIDGGVRFAIDIHTRAANVFDFVAINTVGAPMQNANWKQVVEGVVEASGGRAAKGVETSSEKLGDNEAAAIEDRTRAMVQARKRDEGEPSAEDAP
jgi:uncharacterized protein YbjT (DUF2867 family)